LNELREGLIVGWFGIFDSEASDEGRMADRNRHERPMVVEHRSEGGASVHFNIGGVFDLKMSFHGVYGSSS
jgi:hypothetical protein